MKVVELAGKEEAMSDKIKRERKQKKKVQQGRENRKDYGKLGRGELN